MARDLESWLALVLTSKLPSTTKLVVFGLALCRSERVPWDCDWSVKELAEEIGLSGRAIQAHLGVATARGWIERVPRYREDGGRLPNRYVLGGLGE